MQPRKACACCGKEMAIVARGYCGACYARLVPKEERKKYKRSMDRPNNGEFPKRVLMPIWETSDGTEFGNEIDALRHQLEIERNRGDKR